MHDLFEIGFRETISADALRVFLVEYFHLDKECIVSEDDYWSEEWEGKERIGVTVQTATEGLKTILSGVSFKTLDDIKLENLAKSAASTLNTETVIGDYRKSGIDALGCFLSYFPDGSVWEAVDTSRGQVDDVKVLRQI